MYRIMWRIPGTWHDSSRMSITVEEFCQHRKKKNLASDCWAIVPVIVEELCHWLLKNRASHCWIIMSVTVEQSCQQLLNNRASGCWTIIVPVTWSIVPVTVEQFASDCWIVVPVFFFSLFLTYFGKILTRFLSKYFNCYWLFQFRITTK